MTKLGQGGGLGKSWKRKKAKKPKGISQDQVEKVMRSPKVQAATEAKAKAVQAYWQDIAPIYGDKPPKRAAPTFGHVGSYRDSIVVRDSPDGVGKRVVALDWKARMIEFGNKHMPEYAPLAKVKAKFRK